MKYNADTAAKNNADTLTEKNRRPKRGILINPANRFQPREVIPSQPVEVKADTQFIEVNAKSIISKNQSPDIPFEQSINPYNGCEHGCIYCYARPSHAYLDYSPGIDFETKIVVKSNAVSLFKAAISKPNYQCKPIMLAGNTDIYQAAEKKYQLTRGLLQVCLETKHPVMLITKSALILRDLDILSELAKQQLVSVAVSVTSMDSHLSKTLEPRASSPSARIKAIESLSKAGVPVTLMFAPVIPCINDAELEKVVEAGAEAGAIAAHYIFLRLPLEVEHMFQHWLEQHYPDRKEHVLSIIRQSRGGKLNDSRSGSRMRAEGIFAQMIRQRFQLAKNRSGLSSRDYQGVLTSALFSKPAQIGAENPRDDLQLALF